MEEKEYEILDPESFEEARKNIPTPFQLEQMADFYKIMGDPTRLKILISLERHEFCASDLASLAGMSRSAISHQMKALKSAKLVKSRKEGKTVYYSLDDDHIHAILNVAFSHIFEEE
ncbi:MAG: winged helix-turn-helix transcriptional regulator [Erysipelotrichaceae bacterium]|nr:winged helix-turn-helix transcriptional regulator [Erysipelotrichaceae bacterium]